MIKCKKKVIEVYYKRKKEKQRRLKKQSQRRLKKPQRRKRREQKRVKEKGQLYRVYRYVYNDQKTPFHYGREHTIYVGQTSRSLKKRDYEHRRRDKTPFDRDLKKKYRTAHIVLIAEKRCANSREGKDWMDWMERLSLKHYKCLIGDTPHGCNKNRTRHYKDVDKFANDVREKREFLGEVGWKMLNQN